MKVVATLACRNNSSRLYGKPLQRLGENTVVEYMIQRMKEFKGIDKIVLAISDTKDNLIYTDIAEKHGLKFVMGDDKDVLKRLIDACDLEGGDTVFRVTSESPFTYLEGLDSALASHIQQKADYTIYAKLPDGVTFELINLAALKHSHEHGESKHRSELCTLYINEHKELFKHNILQVDEQWQRPDYRLTIDYPEDLILCRKIVEHFGDQKYIPYQEIVHFLDERPNLRKMVDERLDLNYVKPYY